MEPSSKYLDTDITASISQAFLKSERRLLLFDYDGTLVPFKCEPSKALPDNDLMMLLNEIADTDNIDLVIISGRNRDFLENIFSGLKASLFAEHGAIYRVNGTWNALENDTSWMNEVGLIMNQIAKTTPGSSVELKENSIVWHYRKSEGSIAEKKAGKLVSRLAEICDRNNLTIMKGKKIIEVKPSDYTKGTAIVNFFDCNTYDFILAAGDDVTDEDLFEALPARAIKIHVGKESEIPGFFVRNSLEFVSFLKKMLHPGSGIA